MRRSFRTRRWGGVADPERCSGWYEVSRWDTGRRREVARRGGAGQKDRPLSGDSGVAATDATPAPAAVAAMSEGCRGWGIGGQSASGAGSGTRRQTSSEGAGWSGRPAKTPRRGLSNCALSGMARRGGAGQEDRPLRSLKSRTPLGRGIIGQASSVAGALSRRVERDSETDLFRADDAAKRSV